MDDSIRTKLQWAVFKQKVTEKRLEDLKAAETSLMEIIQILTWRNVALLLAETRQKQDVDHLDRRRNLVTRKIALRKIYSVLLDHDNWFRKLGFSGAYSSVYDIQRRWSSTISLGYQPPTWMSLSSILIELKLAGLPDGMTGFKIVSGNITIQNRVPISSPFMAACKSGDIAMMKQCLGEQPWAIGNRSICTGKTPLLLAIEGENLPAVKLLLEHGADPNVGDDDQVLPAFAVAGMRPRFRRHFSQLPPIWSCWFEAFRLLVNHGASVHEIVRGKTMGTLNVIGRNLKGFSPTDYIKLLHSEGFVDFGNCDSKGYSTLVFEMQCYRTSLETIRYITKRGLVDFSRIMDNGRSYLHFAAELSSDVRLLQHLYVNGCKNYLNRQDQWGWTPLHYCVCAEYGDQSSIQLEKIKFLLEKGADPCIEARTNEMIFNSLGLEVFTPLDMADQLEKQSSRGVGDLLREYINNANTAETKDVFYEAVEFL
ncbi:ankyrin repeat-containing domain protein [Hypoxylon cercidicola]|nr:ankyrin repeat-containing domain protein [Hypoxylon cercidicola]